MQNYSITRKSNYKETTPRSINYILNAITQNDVFMNHLRMHPKSIYQDTLTHRTPRFLDSRGISNVTLARWRRRKICRAGLARGNSIHRSARHQIHKPISSRGRADWISLNNPFDPPAHPKNYAESGAAAPASGKLRRLESLPRALYSRDTSFFFFLAFEARLMRELTDFLSWRDYVIGKGGSGMVVQWDGGIIVCFVK